MFLMKVGFLFMSQSLIWTIEFDKHVSLADLAQGQRWNLANELGFKESALWSCQQGCSWGKTGGGQFRQTRWLDTIKHADVCPHQGSFCTDQSCWFSPKSIPLLLFGGWSSCSCHLFFLEAWRPPGSQCHILLHTLLRPAKRHWWWTRGIPCPSSDCCLLAKTKVGWSC